MSQKAVFLDRDGVVNELVLNPATGDWEAPRHPDDFHILPEVAENLKRLHQAGCRTILVENERSAKKRGTSRPDFIARDLSHAVNLVLECLL